MTCGGDAFAMIEKLYNMAYDVHEALKDRYNSKKKKDLVARLHNCHHADGRSFQRDHR